MRVPVTRRSGRLHLEVLGVEDPGRLLDGETVVLLHQPRDQRFQLGDPYSQLVVLGLNPQGEAAILLEMADESLGHVS